MPVTYVLKAIITLPCSWNLPALGILGRMGRMGLMGHMR